MPAVMAEPGQPVKAPQELIEYRLMEKFHWTYEDLLNTPAEVVANLIQIMNLEAQEAARRSKQDG